MPLQELPFAASAASAAVLEDRGVQSTARALDTVAGVQPNVQAANGYGFIVRGFADSAATLFDGFREDGGLSDQQSVERVEVLKGPASSLYGGGISSGGSVNVVSKRAEAEPFARVEFGGGSFGHLRATLDENLGALGGGVSARVNLSWDRSDTFRRGDGAETFTLAPVMTWEPDDDDTLVVLTRVLHTDYSLDATQTPAVRPVLDLKPSQSYVRGGSGSRDDAARAAALFTHRFGDDVEYRFDASASWTSQRFGTDDLGRFALGPDGVTLARTVLAGPQSLLDVQARNELAVGAATGAVSHQALAGVDLQYLGYRYKDDAAPLPPVDLAAPRPGGVPGAFVPDQDGDVDAVDAGVYVQDYASWGRWHALAGARTDGIYIVSRDRLAGAVYEAPSGGVSPRLGVSFDASEQATVYANVSASLIPNAGSRGPGGAPLPPTRSDEQEAGLKWRSADGALTATLTGYRIAKTDVPVVSLADPNVSFPSGRQGSHGAELELTGRLAPGWDVAAGYAHTVASQDSTAAVPGGGGLPGVPRHAFGGWTSYAFAPGAALSGWGGGIGLRAQTERQATLPNTFRLPGFVQLDASVWRRLTLRGVALRVQADLTNLGDARVYDTDGGAFLRPVSPRSAFVSLAADF